MAYFYVKSGGTATGDAGRYTSQQTGTFAALGTSNYYDNIEDAWNATTRPNAGDFVCVSDLHVHSEGSINSFSGDSADSGHAVIISVSDTNVDQYSAGASDVSSDTNDTVHSGRIAYWGMNLGAGDDYRTNSDNSQGFFVDCNFELTGSADRLQLPVDGCCFELINCEIDIDQQGYLYVGYGGEFYHRAGGFSGAGQMYQDGFIGSGGKVTMEGTDISSFGTGDYLLENVGAATSADDLIIWELFHCETNSAVTYHEEALEGRGHTWLMAHCGSTPAEAHYQYYYASTGCTVEDEITIYRDESTPFPSGDKISYKVVTQADLTKTNLFHFDFPTQYVELSDSGSDVIKIRFASTTTLDDGQVWADISYPDGTNNHVFNYVKNQASDFLNGTEHTTDASSDWRDGAGALSGYNEYEMTLDTSGDVGADGIPTIRIYIGVGSATIYFCSTLELS